MRDAAVVNILLPTLHIMTEDNYSGCYCEIYDGEPPEFSREEWRTAAKEHHCVECQESIKKGEKYHVFSGKWDGALKSFKTCEYCAKLRDKAWCDGYNGAFGQLACYVSGRMELEP